MARKTIHSEPARAIEALPGLPFERPFNDWLEFQSRALGTGLGQVVELQQAMWSNWADFMQAWWRLPDAGDTLNPWLPTWFRGSEQLA